MSNLKIGVMELGEIMANGYYIYKEGNKECIFVDPGYYDESVKSKMDSEGLFIKHILLTHGHYDHILGAKAMKEDTGAMIYAYEDEKDCLNDPGLNLSGARLNCSIDADRYLKDGEELLLSGLTVKVIHTPGHTVGGCCFYFPEDGVLISGDTLFAGSVGRSDFPGGSHSQLIRSIKEKLFLLPDDTKVFPGHMGPTTIESEKKYNPFCQ